MRILECTHSWQRAVKTNLTFNVCLILPCLNALVLHGIVWNSFCLLSFASISVIWPRLLISSIMHQYTWKEQIMRKKWEKGKSLKQEQREVNRHPWTLFQVSYRSFKGFCGTLSQRFVGSRHAISYTMHSLTPHKTVVSQTWKFDMCSNTLPYEQQKKLSSSLILVDLSRFRACAISFLFCQHNSS